MTKNAAFSAASRATKPTVKIYTVWLPCAFLATVLLTRFLDDLWPRHCGEAEGGLKRGGVHMAETRRVESSKDYENNPIGL